MQDRLVSVVPEVFFDVIARFVPGATLVVGALLLVPEAQTTAAALSHALGPVLYGTCLVVAAWLGGFILSVASQPIETIYSFGIHPLNHAMGVKMERWRWIFVALEFIAGLPVLIVVWWKLIGYRFKEPVRTRISQEIQSTFGCCSNELPFWLCFDFVRTTAVGVSASAVVKMRAEATCARSLTLTLVLLGAFVFWQKTFVTAIPLFLCAMFASAALSYYRIQERHRTFFTLLNSRRVGRPLTGRAFRALTKR